MWRCLPQNSPVSIKNNGELNIFYLIAMEKTESENRKGGFFRKLRKPTRKEILFTEKDIARIVFDIEV